MRKSRNLGILAAGFVAALVLFGQPVPAHAATTQVAGAAQQTVGTARSTTAGQGLTAAIPGQAGLAKTDVPDPAALPKTAMPGAYPMPGTYEISFSHIRLGSATPNAVIH